MKTRPPFIRNWRDVEPADPIRPPIMDEDFAFSAPLGAATDLSRLQVLHGRLPPGTRSNPPVASRDEEEFLFVLEGTPDLWLDGYLYRLKEGDGVSLPDRTGVGRAVLNNSKKDVRFFYMSEGSRYGSKFFHPARLDAKANEFLASMGKSWTDAPKHKLGPHDGLTDAKRGKPGAKGSRKTSRPPQILHWQDILEADKGNTYPGSKEQHGIAARFGRKARFSRLGIHYEILKSGRRTSWPHAERTEEEFVYVVSGKVEAWVDGYLHTMTEGDLVGFPCPTGVTHVMINNSGEDVHLLVGSEASRARAQFYYPLNDKQNKAVGGSYWKDHPKVKLGPHDGMPDALRTASRKKRGKTKKARK